MKFDTQTIDRIVAGVLKQLSTDDRVARPDSNAIAEKRRANVDEVRNPASSQDTGRGGTSTIQDNLITADVLLKASSHATDVVVRRGAIVTPAAWDAAKERNIRIRRDSDRPVPHANGATQKREKPAINPLLVVVRHTDAVGRLIDDDIGQWRREISGCPDDAATLAISAICRGDALTVVIVAEQTHRAACIANRNERVKAVAVRDGAEVRSIRAQLRPNVWCLDPLNRTWFELRQLLQSIAGGA